MNAPQSLPRPSTLTPAPRTRNSNHCHLSATKALPVLRPSCAIMAPANKPKSVALEVSMSLRPAARVWHALLLVALLLGLPGSAATALEGQAPPLPPAGAEALGF